MKKSLLSFILIFVLTSVCPGCTREKPIAETQFAETQLINKEADTMELKSNDFKEGGPIPLKFTCQGDNINPHLEWSNPPEGVKSFALIVDDPDAPVGTWVHWLVKDIPPAVREVRQNTIPGREVVNSFGKKGYGGPCPPSGVHRYFFRLYALNVETLEAEGKADFYREAERNAIDKAELMGRYEKKKS